MSQTAPWIIVGGGASGLASAFFLKQLGMDSVIVERDGAIGGRMGTAPLGERMVDCGGKNIGRQYELFRRFAASLGDHPFEYFGLNSSQAVEARVKTFDGGSRWRSMGGLVRGLATRDVVRFAQVLGRVKWNRGAGYLGSDYARRLSARYDKRPVSWYFSPEFCARIIRPMTVRMNGAEPDEVYMGTLASNVRMILDTYEQFTHGLAPLLATVLDRYDVRLNASVEGLLIEQGRAAGVHVRSRDGATTTLRGAGVILAAPAHASAALTAPVLRSLAAQLRSVSYYPVTLAVAEYDRPIFSPAVRALVFDSREPVSNAGAYGANDLHLVRYTFSGRLSRGIDGSTDGDALVRLGEAALAKHVAVDARWRRRFVTRHFNPGLCAYTRNHATFVDNVTRESQRLPGLYLTGDYIQGASIEACFRAASACVARVSVMAAAAADRISA